MIQERKRQEMVRLEQQMEEEQNLQSKLAAQAATNKKHLLSFVAEVSTIIEELDIVENI